MGLIHRNLSGRRTRSKEKCAVSNGFGIRASSKPDHPCGPITSGRSAKAVGRKRYRVTGFPVVDGRSRSSDRNHPRGGLGGGEKRTMGGSFNRFSVTFYAPSSGLRVRF